MKAEFYFDCHKYICSLVQVDFVKELKIKNHQGFVLAVKQGEKIGLLGKSRHNAKKVDVSKSHFYNVIKAAMSALELENRNELILERNRTIADAEELIQQQNREIRLLNEQIRMLAARVEQLSMEKQQLSMQLVEKEIRETEISQEIDDFPASEEDLVAAEIEKGIGEVEISQQIAPLPIQNPGLDVQLIENSRDSQGSEEEAKMTGSDVKSVNLEIREEVDFPGGKTEIKRLPKRGSQRRMRKK
jgi:DNA gyrase/topoisomerase IV subunit A